MTTSSASTRFVYDGARMIAEYYDNNTNALKARYVHGPGVDAPIVQYDYSSPSSFTRSWYVTDQKGSITGRTNAAGTSLSVNSYSLYGQPDAANVGRFQYTGQVWLEEVGLKPLPGPFSSIFDSRDQKSWLRHTASKDYKARFYDPTIKRFLNADPIGYGDGLNMYSYVGGDPVNRRDPSGMRTCHGTPDGVACQESGDGVSIYPGTQDWQDLRAMYDNSFDFGDSFVGGLLNDLQISIRRALDANIPKIAACAAGKAIVTAAKAASLVNGNTSLLTSKLTTVVGLNGGMRIGNVGPGGTTSLLYVENGESSAIGVAENATGGTSGNTGKKNASFYTSISLGVTPAPIDTFTNGSSFTVGRGFVRNIGASLTFIPDNASSGLWPMATIEVGLGTAKEFSVGIFSGFQSCQ
ncbi:RHS repeat-associated core domain-containing protein [Litorimonas taeanensis]|uniref:RHS repeat-associated core domain-containing protein n=1 Tax=Litorimonas taeanensis TaxID=568099 RepID=UPI0011C4655C|nr:RHS repeat-associated core domain-containing protein [Litorimonas taeanensis]